MAKSSQSHRNGRRQTEPRTSNSRGVVPIRRKIHESSWSVFELIAERLTPEFRGVDRIFTPETLTVTVVGYSKFDRRHRQNGPDTIDVAKSIPSLQDDLYAKIGALGIFGGGTSHKLAFQLESDDLENEFSACRDAFAARRYPLLNRYSSESEFVPHCSVGYLHKDNVSHHRENLRRYTRLAAALGEVVLLSPPNIVN